MVSANAAQLGTKFFPVVLAPELWNLSSDGAFASHIQYSHTNIPIYHFFFFHFKQNANVTLLVLRSGHISVHLTGLAIGQWWDYIFSLGLHFWSSQIWWICICNSCVFVYTLMCLSASHTVMYISLLYLDINSWTLHKVPVVPLVTLDVLKSNFMLLHWPVPHCFDPHNSSTLCSTQQGSTSVWIYYLDTIHIHLR